MVNLRNAIELDEYLGAVSDEEFEKRRATVPVGYRDQLEAASNKARESQEKTLGSTSEWVPRTDLVDWVRLGMYDALVQWFKGKASTCIHMPTPEFPEPVFAAAWMPGVVVCGSCEHLLTVTGVADKTCDGCGHVCEGLPDDGITPVTTFVSSLGYQVGVCNACHKEMREAEARG